MLCFRKDSLVDIIPNKGNNTTGIKAVMGSGIASVHQYAAINKTVYAAYGSCKS